MAELLRAPVACEPLLANAPLHAPDAWQVDALVEVQLRVVESPLLRLLAAAVSETVGTGVAPLPPPPQATSDAIAANAKRRRIIIRTIHAIVVMHLL